MAHFHKEITKALKEKALAGDLRPYSPVIFNLNKEADNKQLAELLGEKKRIHSVHDEIKSQLFELFKIRSPGINLKDEQREKMLFDYLRGRKLEEIGNWVYYPWSGKLVHLIEEEEFAELRTSRNKYKITPEEQESLKTKVVGVIGLSVGQSVALTMAMERSFGLLKIADFDHLELTNLNRIRRGVESLGLPKTIMVAREIAEIDPYLKVELFSDGITAENIEDFLGGERPLDLLIEECDSLDVKILARLKAREKGIPTLMDTSDRGLIDIERFDLEPERPIMHGMVSDDQAKNLEQWTAKERLALVMDMVGVDQISSRLKASLLEVDESITTWPQLASSVIYGGAVCALIARHILLGQAVKSGRHYFDPESQLNLEEKKEAKLIAQPKPAPLDVEELKEMALSRSQLMQGEEFLRPEEDTIKDLVEHACHAPSGGNVQPWKWLAIDKTLFLFHDKHFSYSFLDFKHRGSLIGLGAALENLKQRASHFQLKAHIDPLIEDYGDPLIARIGFSQSREKPAFYFGDLLQVRLTNRLKGFDQNRIEPKLIAESYQLLEDPAFRVSYLEKRADLEAIADVIAKVERQRILDPWGHRDFIAEARWTKEEAESTRDGVDLRTMELTEADQVGFKLIRDEQAMGYLRSWNKGMALVKMSKDTLVESSAIGLIYTDHHSAQQVLAGGAWLERLWLYWNSQGIAFQPVSPSTFMFARLGEEDSSTSDYLRQQLQKLRAQYLELFDLDSKVNDLFLFRLFHAAEPQVRSLRKELDEVLKIIK